MISKEDSQTKFEFIETNFKALNEKSDIEQISEASKKMRLTKKDLSRIRRNLEEQDVPKQLIKHLKAALHDAFVVLTLPKSAVRQY